MKKFMLPILLLLMIIPVVANAKEYCTVVSGNGKDIGSEITCGTEHFYIVENKDNNIKMLAKYNLYVGAIYDKTTLDINKIYIKYECNNDECYYNPKYYFEGNEINNRELWEEKIKEKYNFDEIHEVSADNGSYISNGNIALYSFSTGPKYNEENITYQNVTYKLYPYQTIFENDSRFALQNELARGVFGEKGNANYPIYATLTLFGDYDEETMYMPMSYYIKSYDNYQNGFINFEFQDDAYIKRYLNAYKSKLNDMGYDIEDVDLINLEEINDFVYKETNKELPLSSWYNASINSNVIEEDGSEYFKLGDLKEYLSNDFSWLWNTSYWTKTIVGNDLNMSDRAYNHMTYFVSSSGEICFSGSDCWSSIPRAGIRPTVIVAKDNIKYLIRTKTDGNGTIEVVSSAFGGDSIQFKISAKKGLKLAGLTITTDSGEKVEFSEADITTDSSGVLSVSLNKFTMPYENVTIEARWASSIINPNTGTGVSVIIITIVLLVSSITYIILKRKKNYIIK